MDPAFLYKLPAGTSVFRATTISKGGRWYTLSLKDAYTYGENITEYVTTKELVLLNITSLSFHIDYMDRLSSLYPGKDHIGLDINKVKGLIPLGLIDLPSQIKNLNFIGINGSLDETKWDSILEYSSNNLLNRHRFSDHGLDTNFVSILEQIYGEKFHGYISPIQWPTKLHGYFFPRELCIFKLGNGVNEVTLHKRPTSGGANEDTNRFCNMIDTSNIDYNKIQESLNKEIEKTLSSNSVKIFWNSHTEEAYPPCNPVSELKVSGGKRYTRRKIRHLKN